MHYTVCCWYFILDAVAVFMHFQQSRRTKPVAKLTML